MRIYLYKKHDYLSKYKLYIMKPVMVEADINLLTKSPLNPVPVENSPGSMKNDVYSVDLTDSKSKTVRGIIVYKTKKGVRAYLSSIKKQCPYTETMEEIIESDRTDRPWVSIMPHKETDTQISPCTINHYDKMHSVVIDREKYYHPEATGLPTLIYMMKDRAINGHQVQVMDYMLIRRNRGRFGAGMKGKRRVFFDIKYEGKFARLYDFSKIESSVINAFNNQGIAAAVRKDTCLTGFSFIKARYLIKNPGKDYMLKHWHETGRPPVNTPYYLFDSNVSMSFAADFTVIDSPRQAAAILSRVSNNIFLPQDKPAKPSYNIRYASGDFLLGYPEVNSVTQ